MSTSGGTSGGTSPVSVATAHLDGAALAALFSAPTQIVAAPGANKVLAVVGAFAEYVIGAAGTSHYDGGLGIGWLSGGTFFAATGVWSSNPLTLLPQVTKVSNFPLPLGGASGQSKTNAVNKPLCVGDDNASGSQVGPIVTATIAAAGAGYVPGDTGTIGPDPFTSSTDATYHVTTVDGGGAVTAFTVTAAGTGYETASNPQPTAVGGAQPGIGTGFTVNVTAIGALGGDLYVTCLYQIVTTH